MQSTYNQAYAKLKALKNPMSDKEKLGIII